MGSKKVEEARYKVNFDISSRGWPCAMLCAATQSFRATSGWRYVCGVVHGPLSLVEESEVWVEGHVEGWAKGKVTSRGRSDCNNFFVSFNLFHSEEACMRLKSEALDSIMIPRELILRTSRGNTCRILRRSPDTRTAAENDLQRSIARGCWCRQVDEDADTDTGECWEGRQLTEQLQSKCVSLIL
jgi:hypothetical protein